MKVELSEIEITHIMDALRHRVNDLRAEHAISGDAATIDAAWELEEIEHDLMEISARRDGWGDGAVDRFPDAALDMVQTGIDAREQVKASSRAAQRRETKLRQGERSDQQRVDLWANDPIDW